MRSEGGGDRVWLSTVSAAGEGERGCGMQLKASTRSVGGTVIIDCSGKIVFGDETAFLRQLVKELLNESKKIVLNLGSVNYIDSSGVGTLVSLYTSVGASGGQLKLAGLSGRVRDVLAITKLVTVFETHETVEEAVSSFNPAGGRSRAAGPA